MEVWRSGDRPRKIEKIVSDLIGQEGADRFWIEFRKNYITEADIQRIAELDFNSVRPALNVEGNQPVSGPTQQTERTGLGGRDRGEGQRHLLGHDPVIRGPQHRLVVLALEEDEDTKHALFHQGAARVGHHSSLFPRAGQAFPGRGIKGL